MKERFDGEGGAQLLRTALRDQAVLDCCDELIGEVAGALDVEELEPGQILTEQGAAETAVYFILMGAGIEVLVDGTPVAARNPKEIVGEMAAIEPAGVRSATLRAAQPAPTVVGRLDATIFTKLCSKYPERLYRGIARVIADRLRQRAKFIRPRSARSTVFIGSSREGLQVAKHLQAGLDHSGATVEVWSDGTVFNPSATPIEDLTKALDRFDFAVFVLSPDDVVRVQGPGRDNAETHAPRDNVLFEFGMFIGALGRERVFAVSPRSARMRVPTDLAGVNPMTYDDENPQLRSAVGTICTELAERIHRYGPR